MQLSNNYWASGTRSSTNVLWRWQRTTDMYWKDKFDPIAEESWGRKRLFLSIHAHLVVCARFQMNHNLTMNTTKMWWNALSGLTITISLNSIYSFNHTTACTDSRGTELYDHTEPGPMVFFIDESTNMAHMANDPNKQDLVRDLHRILQAG